MPRAPERVAGELAEIQARVARGPEQRDRGESSEGTPRLLQAMAGAAVGGAEAFFERLAPAFARTGVPQRVLIRRHARRAAALRAAGVETVELRFGGRADLATRPAFRREIIDFRPDIVLTWMSRATAFCPKSTGASGFVHVARLGGYYDLKYYRRADHLIANTADIVDYLGRRGWPEDRRHYLPNFVDGAAAAAVERAGLGTPQDAPLVLALGRLHQNKAFDVLLDALAESPGVWAWIAGEGPLRTALEAQAARLGVADRVRFLGWREDVSGLLSAADVLACPSRHEPLGNVVIEGWAHGVPVVAAASQGPGALIVDGDSGLLAPVGDAGALAGAIRRLAPATADAAALRQRLAAGGRMAYEAAFTESAAVTKYLDFFRRVIASRA